jgi:hypothetical protein
VASRGGEAEGTIDDMLKYQCRTRNAKKAAGCKKSAGNLNVLVLVVHSRRRSQLLPLPLAPMQFNSGICMYLRFLALQDEIMLQIRENEDTKLMPG